MNMRGEIPRGSVRGGFRGMPIVEREVERPERRIRMSLEERKERQ
jgi:hypothetical protein